MDDSCKVNKAKLISLLDFKLAVSEYVISNNKRLCNKVGFLSFTCLVIVSSESTPCYILFTNRKLDLDRIGVFIILGV
jgi:hypothetical protein